MKFNVIFAKHQNSEKIYLFEIDVRQINPTYIKSGDTLFVDTCYGMAVATAVTNVISVEESNFVNFVKICGAYLPLRKCTEKISGEFANCIQNTQKFFISPLDELPF